MSAAAMEVDPESAEKPGESASNGKTADIDAGTAKDTPPNERGEKPNDDERSPGRSRSRDGDDKDAERNDRRKRDEDRDRGRERGRDREDREGGKEKRERKSRDRDRERDKDSKRSRDDDRGEKSSKRSRRSHSRDRKRRDSRERRRRRSRSRSRRRSHSREHRRSRSKGSHRHRSKSRDRRRRRRGSSSGSDFGGYVPRKRQEPPSTVAGYSAAFVDPYAALRSKQPLPTDPESIKKRMQEQQLRARQMVLQQQASSAIAAASKTQREIYVGNLVQGLVTEEAMRQLFNSTMKAAFPEQQMPGLDPVVSVSMHSEGRYAFVELRTPEMASAALQLSGQVQLLGQSISVGRPSGYVDPSTAQMAAAQAATALQAYEAGSMSIEEAAQAMNTITMPGVSASQPPTSGVSPGPGRTPPALPPPPKAGATPPGGLPAPPGALPPPPAGVAPPAGALPTAPVGLPAAPPAAPAGSVFLQVTGMVNAEVLADDEEYAEIIEDLREECGKFGQLLGIAVPRPPNPAESAALVGQGFYGKAFVRFANPDGCAKAKAAIHGRMFAGETIQADFVDEQIYRQAGGA